MGLLAAETSKAPAAQASSAVRFEGAAARPSKTPSKSKKPPNR